MITPMVGVPVAGGEAIGGPVYGSRRAVPDGKPANTGRLGPHVRVPGSSAPPRRMTSERSPASDDLARALDRAVYASLRPVLIALTVLFCLFAIAHPLVLPAGWPCR